MRDIRTTIAGIVAILIAVLTYFTGWLGQQPAGKITLTQIVMGVVGLIGILAKDSHPTT